MMKHVKWKVPDSYALKFSEFFYLSLLNIKYSNILKGEEKIENTFTE